ncbi:hypothetical protein BU24DRAFT_224005 [Aaosphaeria arxii CBS 175.79]|uniref:Uncharacterized protein n=1 Tax=Aaosphaeria arxii CBS 175.79 TaxID=1450172 RepID=A0A6A5XNU9_9PLEO|nr:uncharacterized protein BU24DRAFT_224005 [Aaosphaeria arxii CBS 175.79]KAF2014918.1 hypothetical protein BU24DRAFT_224005 [Aaosphaeria arxii CBS 175.79]
MVKPLPLVQVSHVLQHCNEQSVECFAMTGVEFHFLTKQWDFPKVISDLTRLCIKLFLVSSEFKVELRGSVSQDYMQRGKDLFAGLIESARPAASCVSEPDSLTQCSQPAEAQTASYHHQPDFLALDPVEDAVALVTWHQFLLPEFPLIAKQSPIRGRYSVSLVAQVKDNTKHLIIRFRSSENQSNACRDFIRKRVEEICKEHGRVHFPVQFSQGTLVRLLGTAPSHNDSDDPSTDQKFAHHRRFWQTPGMGASIGLSQCPKISATLGGYILVDGRLFMLSVDHFISKCGCPNKTTSVRSPAHSDAQELKKQVEERLQDINSRLSRNGETEINLSNYSQVIDRHTQMEIDLYERFRRELMQDESRFNFGHVHRRSGDGSPPTRPAAIPVTPGEVRRTDWSLTEVTERARVGQNAHRHSRMSVPTLEDLRSEVMKPEGTGALVTTTANVRGGEAVHYVGTTSGLRPGRVNPAITLYGTEGGEISHEWTIAVEGNAKLNSEAFSGDSGAWIMNDDNELLGHLWGWDGGLLWFTPIADVFQDIREHLNAASVTLRDDRLRLNSQGLISRGEGCSETNNEQLEEQGTKMARPNPSPSPSPMRNLLSPTDAEDKGRKRSSSVGSDLSIFSLPSLGSSSSMSSITEGNSPQVPGSPCSFTAFDDIGDSEIVSQKLPPTDESCDWYDVRQDAELKDEEFSREDTLELTLRPRRVVGIKTF